MNISLFKNRERAVTLVELLVVLVVAAAFILLFFAQASKPRPVIRALQIQCLFDLKQIGLAEQSWAADHGDKYPFEISETNGGTMEFTTGTNAFRHFQVMSNELSWTKVLICPADEARIQRSTNFARLNNSEISYFVGLDAVKSNPRGILSGDCNITTGQPLQNGILEVTATPPASWTAEGHKKAGNILLSDGTAQKTATTDLQTIVQSTGIFTNRLQMPIVGP